MAAETAAAQSVAATRQAVAEQATAAAAARAATATTVAGARAATATAAVVARASTATAVAEIRAATQTAVAERIKATQQAQAEWNALIAEYENIPARDLVTYPDNHKGEKVKVRGRIFNINSDTELQIFLAGTYDAVYVIMADSYSDLYEDDVITVYGTVYGESCGENAMGGQVCQPVLIDAFYVK
ncbi:MAG: hypothetical protein M1546_14395 [Chloroflexi bacterium]|nr:hypothetical protein [Chloroflexota bacterium]